MPDQASGRDGSPVKAVSDEPYEVVDISSWESYVAAVDDLEGWVFRGQEREDWPLETSIQRYAVGVPIKRAEGIAVHEFRRRAQQYINGADLPLSADILDWLALMQHHGAPTRLLDWTRSPYVGLFFALENATDPDGHSVVWAIDYYWCFEALERHFGENADEAIRTHAKDLAFTVTSDSGQFFRHVIAKSPLAIIPVDPYRQIERVSIQQGVFLAPGNLDQSFLHNLLANADGGARKYVFKYVISNALRPYALQRLRVLMSISRASLFPGLDGYAQSLRHLIVAETPAEMKRRAMLRAIGGDYGLYAKPVPRGSPRTIGDLMRFSWDDMPGTSTEASRGESSNDHEIADESREPNK
jgi:hypothetical protein